MEIELEHCIFEFITLCRKMFYSQKVGENYILDIHSDEIEKFKQQKAVIKVGESLNLYKCISESDELYNWKLIKRWTQKVDDDLRLFVPHIEEKFERYNTTCLVAELQTYVEKWQGIRMPWKKPFTSRNNAAELEHILSKFETCLHQIKVA